MTVESAKNKSGPFIATGPGGTFPRDFLIRDASHLRVLRVRDGIEADLTEGIGHTGIGTPDGTVVVGAGLAPGDKVYLLRDVPMLQRTDYANQGRVRPDVIEGDFDKLQMQVQDLAERQRRALTLGVSSEIDGGEAMRAALAAPQYAESARASAGAAAQSEANAAALVPFSLRQFGAVGDGAIDDTAAINTALAGGRRVRGSGKYRTSGQISITGALDGNGSEFVKHAPGLLSSLIMEAGSRVRDLILNMRFSETTGADGHGIVMRGSDSVVEDVTVRDFGTENATSGSGVGVIHASSFQSENVRFRNSTLIGDPTAALSFGWLLSNDKYGFVDNILSRDVTRYAHELKNDCQFNMLHALTAVDSQYALAYGQQGGNGADRNIAFGVMGDNCDNGAVVGWGEENVFSAAVYYGGPVQLFPAFADVTRNGIRAVSAHRNLFSGHLLTGTFDYAVKAVNSDNNVFSFADHQSGEPIRVEGTSKRNLFEVKHPGTHNTVADRLSQAGGWNYTGPNANVVVSPATGERIGSLSGRFHDKLGQSGAVPNSDHSWLREHTGINLEAVMTRRVAGLISGTTYILSDGTQGRFWYVQGAAPADDYFDIGVGNEHAILKIRTSRASFRKPVQLPSYSLSSKPTASSVGAGSQIYVTDGDAGGPCLAVSDGTNWRRVSLGEALA